MNFFHRNRTLLISCLIRGSAILRRRHEEILRLSGRTHEEEFNNATVYTRFERPIAVFEIGDRNEGGRYKVSNRFIDASGPRYKDALIEVFLTAQAKRGTTSKSAKSCT